MRQQRDRAGETVHGRGLRGLVQATAATGGNTSARLFPFRPLPHQVATPAQWKNGDDVIITAAVSDEDATKRFGTFERVLPYLRTTRQPASG